MDSGDGLDLGENLETEDFDSESEENPREATTFDISLPTRHEYLGEHLEELRGRTLHDEGSIVSIPILLELGIVLIPGQTLPLTVFYPATINMLRDVIAKDRTFGIICLKESHSREMIVCEIGTTAEIFQFSEENAIAGFKIKAKGRQRFKLLGQKREASGILYGKVQILPEVCLPSPLHEARLSSLNPHRRNSQFQRRCSRYDTCASTWPKWVLDQYDPDVLTRKVLKQLKALKFVPPNNVPSDAVHLSYWVMQCLPIDDAKRVWLLGLHSAVERLQYALKIIAECEGINCKMCGVRLAWRHNIFSMSADGPFGLYVNPGGYVHEILTLYDAEELNVSTDPPSTQCSWFPGYGWQIAQCSRCLSHSGWVFTAVTTDLNPQKFFGLARRSVNMQPEVQYNYHQVSAVLEEFYANA